MNKSQLYDKIEALLLAECGQYGYTLSGSKDHDIIKSYTNNGTTCNINIGISVGAYRDFKCKVSLYAGISYIEICQPVIDHYIYGEKNLFSPQVSIGEWGFSPEPTREIATGKDLEAYFEFLRRIIQQNILPYFDDKTDIKKFAPFFLDYTLARKLDSAQSSMSLAYALVICRYAQMPNLDNILNKLYRQSKRTFDHDAFKKFLVKQGFKMPTGILTWF